jgi:hypothetical protein
MTVGRINGTLTHALQFRNCNAQKSCFFCAWIKLSTLQRGRQEKEFARRQIDIGTADFAAQTTNDCKLTARRDLARGIEIPFLNLE